MEINISEEVEMKKIQEAILQISGSATRLGVDTNKIKIAEFMSDKIGEEYEGVISGVTSFGVFVELENTVEGLVHISHMVDDYYIYDDEKKELFGQGSHKVFKIGDSVKIRVENVSIAKAEIDFAFI